MLEYSKEAEKVWQQFVNLGGKSLYYKRKAQELIPVLAANKIYLKHKFSSLEAAVAQVAGIGSETVRKILEAHRRTEDLPELRKVMPKVGYSKINTVLALKNKVAEKELVDMVKELPTQTLREKVSKIKNPNKEGQHSLFDQTTTEINGSDYQKLSRFSSEITNELEQSLNLIKHKLEQEKGHPISNQELLEYFVSKEQLPQNPSSDKQDFSKNKTLTPKHKSYIKAKNKGTCQAPNCNKVAAEIHHPYYQSLEPNKHQNLKAYCKVHHQLAHYDTQNKTPEQIQIDKKVQRYWQRK